MDRENDSISKLLAQKATENELEYLSLKGQNTFTKAISIKTLINRKSSKIIGIFENLIDSKDTMVYGTESLSTTESLPNFIFQSLVFNRNYSEEEINSNKEIMVRKILDKNPVNTTLLSSIAYWIPQDESFYEPIRKIVIEERSPALLVTIAKYKKEADIELIKSFGFEALPAIEEFPNEQFREILENDIRFDDYRYMFALAKSCTPETVKTVEKALQLKIADLKNSECGNYCLATIYNQVEMNQCELFYPALQQLWLSNKIISYNIIKNYAANHSKKETENFLFKGFMLKGNPQIIHQNMYDDTNFVADLESGSRWNNEVKIVHVLKELRKYSNKKYLKALRNTIIEIKDLDLYDFVRELKDSKSLEIVKNAFIEKMKTKNNAYGLLLTMDAIKLLDDGQLFDKGFEIIKQRKNEFREKWEKSLQEFLTENDLKLE